MEFKALGAYLKKINSSLDSSKSMTEVFDTFRCMSKEYQEFSNNESLNNKDIGEYDYLKASKEEQESLMLELSTVECLVTNSIYEKRGFIRNWKYIFDLLLDDFYAQTEKTNRKVVFPVESNDRPIGDNSYLSWNGMQIIDLDIKDKTIANKLKTALFDSLKKYHWFLGVCTSASGKGLHVWTKISPISVNLSNRKIEYLCNFRHKYSYVYIILSKYASELGYTKEQILDFMDMAMAKPQQGIFISSDKKAKMNVNFQDLRLDANFETAFDTGIESINWISHPDLKAIFAKLEWFNNDKFNSRSNVDITEIDNIDERDKSKSIKKHYKHAQRWQLANTLTSLYGFDKALALMCEICDGTEYKELRGDIKTASIHNKPISIWAVKELNKYHGFKIELKNTDKEYDEVAEEVITKDKEKQNPTEVLNNKSNVVNLYLKKNEYLSHLKDDIISNLSHITLLEAGAGYGKTEMIKSFKAKTLLILPFTSTIKSKVETSETTSDWLYYYGNKRPILDDILGDKSMSMTIDKFSKLNVMELDSADFEYIVLDESHLLFTSSYRDVMAPTIQRLANCKAKIILMTGTPTGELLFFPNIKHIKVIKEDVRVKTFQLNMCPGSTEQLIEMCKMMANDILEGKKILFPTNRGNLYFEQVTGIVQQYLDKTDFGRQLNAFYYKKSNYNDESMDNINIDKTIGNNDIVFCTTYLSVGVDICDKYVFSVYFNEQWIPQDIEQFANRLRNNDLHIKMFLPKTDNSGFAINYYYTQPLDLGLNKEDLLLARDLIKTCNDMIERNNEESKYNPLIQSLLSSNKYLKYDENDCKYYIDETTYKLKVFEERYSAYSKQLEIMLKGLRYYGYSVEYQDYETSIPEDKKEEIKEYLKGCRNRRFNYNTIQTFKFLDTINEGNIEEYKEILRGNYDILKANKNMTEFGDQNLYVEDIEIVERNTPIVVGLYKFYDCDTIKDIYQYCTETKQNRINFSKLNRIRKFVVIEGNRQKNRIDFPVMKFIKDAQSWAERNIKTTKNDIEEFQKFWAAKYANTIPDVVVDDVKYLEKIYDLIKQLWDVVIIQDRPKNGIISVRPFELLWERKTNLDNVYGTENTKLFFLEELIDSIKNDDNQQDINKEDEELENRQLPFTRKYKLEQIEHELKHVIHDGFDYSLYSELDKSNDRFMLKQTNTNMIKGSLFDKSKSQSDISYMESKKNENSQPTLFGEELPF